MSTKIVIIQLKEIIYTAIFVALGIFLILMLIFMFSPKKNHMAQTSATFSPGVYTSSFTLDNKTVNVEVLVDDNHINSIRLVDLEPAVETLYPLLQPSLDNISSQIIDENISLDDLTYTADNKYTSAMLLDAIKNALDKSSK